MTEDWSERFLTHYIDGAWRAPLSETLAPTALQGRFVVLASPADLRRALEAAQAAAPSWNGLDPARRRAALAPVWRAGRRPSGLALGHPVLVADPGDGSLEALVGPVLASGDVAIVLGNAANPEPAFRFIDACHDADLPPGVIGFLYTLDGAATAAAMNLPLRKV